MAQVFLPPFIRSISGRIGKLCFRTCASGKTFVCRSPARQLDTPVSDSEMRARALFAQRVLRVNSLRLENPDLTKKQAWTIVKQLEL